jgi:hypothetical protein
MFKKIALAAAIGVAAAGAQAAQTVTYGWEDGVGTVLGSFGTELAFANTDAISNSGSRSLAVADVDAAGSGTPQGYLAWIQGLTDGDSVTASFFAYDVTPGAAPSLRIWGHYTDAGVDSFAGSAGGNNTFSGDAAWTELSHTWTFDSSGGTRDGLVVEVRFYDSSSVPTGEAFVDDLTVTVSSDTATIVAPVPLPGAVWLLGSAAAGLVTVARRRAA